MVKADTVRFGMFVSVVTGIEHLDVTAFASKCKRYPVGRKEDIPCDSLGFRAALSFTTVYFHVERQTS